MHNLYLYRSQNPKAMLGSEKHKFCYLFLL
nr:MAG TPA: hypothetical protein [Bacteriophage sp.]